MRLFELQRDRDATGVSGTGVVAQGVEFDDGTVSLRWLTQTASTAVYGSIGDVEVIHGHEGATRIVFHDMLAAARKRILGTANVVYMSVVDEIAEGLPSREWTNQQAVKRDGAQLMFRRFTERLTAQLGGKVEAEECES